MKFGPRQYKISIIRDDNVKFVVTTSGLHRGIKEYDTWEIEEVLQILGRTNMHQVQDRIKAIYIEEAA